MDSEAFSCFFNSQVQVFTLNFSLVSLTKCSAWNPSEYIFCFYNVLFLWNCIFFPREKTSLISASLPASLVISSLSFCPDMAVFSPEFKRQQRFRDTHQTSATTDEQNENSVFFVVVRASNFVRWGLADFTDSNWVFFFFSSLSSLFLCEKFAEALH